MLQNTRITTMEQLFEAGMNGYNVYSKEDGQLIAFLESVHPHKTILPRFTTNPKELQETFITFFSSAIEDVFAYSYGESIKEYLIQHFSSQYFLKPFDIDSIHFLVKKSFSKIKAHHIKNLFSIFPQFIYKPQDSFDICEYLTRFSKEELGHIATTEHIYETLTHHNQGHRIHSAEHFLRSIHAFLKSPKLPPLEKISPAPHIVQQYKESSNEMPTKTVQEHVHTAQVVSPDIHTNIPQSSTQTLIPKEKIHPTTSVILDNSQQHYTSSDEPKQHPQYTLEQEDILYEENPSEEELFYQDTSSTNVNNSLREAIQCTKKEFENALAEIEALFMKQNTLFPLLNELFTDEKRNLFAFISYYHSYPITKQQGQLDALQHAHSVVKMYKKHEQQFSQETRFVVLLTLAQNSNIILENDSSLSTRTLPVLRAIDRYQHFLPNFPALLIEIYEIALIATFSEQYYDAPMANEEDIALIFRHINIISAISLIKEINEGKNSLLFAREFAQSSIDDIQQYPEYFNAYYFQIMLENTINSIMELISPYERNSHYIFTLIDQVQKTYDFQLENDNERAQCLEYLLYILSHAKKLAEENGTHSTQTTFKQLLQQKITP
ncbi:MAG: hypothetical protein ACRCV3_02860 [Desulfovibrionaceae bacterium]